MKNNKNANNKTDNTHYNTPDKELVTLLYIPVDIFYIGIGTSFSLLLGKNEVSKELDSSSYYYKMIAVSWIAFMTSSKPLTEVTVALAEFSIASYLDPASTLGIVNIIGIANAINSEFVDSFTQSLRASAEFAIDYIFPSSLPGEITDNPPVIV